MYSDQTVPWCQREIGNAFIITVTGEQAWVSNAAGVTEFSGAQLDEQLKQVRVAWAARALSYDRQGVQAEQD